MRHLVYENLALCRTPPAAGVLLAFGQPTERHWQEAENRLVQQPCETNCPLCQVTYALWADGDSLTGVLEALTEFERTALENAKAVAMHNPPDSHVHQIAAKRFQHFLKRYEEKANRWVLAIRRTPVLA